MSTAMIRAKADCARALADSTLRRAVKHEEWGYREEAARLLERALKYEADAKSYETSKATRTP